MLRSVTVVNTPFSSAGVIRRFLHDVRTRLLWAGGARAALWTLTALLSLSLALPLLAAKFGGNAGYVILGLGIVSAFATLFASVVIGLLIPRRKFRGDAAVARFVGLKVPPVASDLLSCVEFSETSEVRGAPSTQLVDALMDATAQRVALVEPRSLISRRPVHRAALVVIVVAIVHAALLTFSPAALALGWKNLFGPPSRPFGAAELVNKPLVSDLQVTLVAPAYTGRAAVVLRSTSGDFRALPGTEVTVEATPLSTSSATELILELSSGGPPTIIPLRSTDGKSRPAAHFTVNEAGRYRFSARDEQRRLIAEQLPRSIELEVDQSPSVQLIAPADDLDVTRLRQIELAYVVDDDFGIGSLILTWQAGPDTSTKVIPLSAGQNQHAEGKLVWDLAELTLPPGAEVRYWLDATDNDNVGESQRGRSREFRLHVYSPRQEHAKHLADQRALVEKMIFDLATRLPGLGDDAVARVDAHQRTSEIAIASAALGAAFAQDPHASAALRSTIMAIRERLDKLLAIEARVLDKLPRGVAPPSATRGLGGKLSGSDARLISELEDDIIRLADWLDREEVEGMLDVADEVAAHQRRLAELLAEAARTGDPAALAAITRELRALEQSLADLEAQRAGLAEDVLDRFVNADAARAQIQTAPAGCVADVRALVASGKLIEAQARLATCQAQFSKVAGGLETALDGLRGDKFGDEQREFDEVRSELADLGQEQEDIAAEASGIFDRYAAKVDEAAKTQGADAQRQVATLLERIRRRLNEAPAAGLTPFSTEELDIVRRRLDDVERMSGDGDLAEAQAMARQAFTSLDTIAAELEAALEDEPTSRWADDTRVAEAAIENTLPIVRELIELLGAATPSPQQLLSAADRAALEKLRRRQAGNADRAQKLVERARAASKSMPGTSAAEVDKQVSGAQSQMRNAESRMRTVDPAGARQSARSAADSLAKAREQMQDAARQRQDGASQSADQPIKIPGAEAYRVPERFREDLLEAMKQAPPDGYDDQVRQYYEDLIK